VACESKKKAKKKHPKKEARVLKDDKDLKKKRAGNHSKDISGATGGKARDEVKAVEGMSANTKAMDGEAVGGEAADGENADVRVSKIQDHSQNPNEEQEAS